MLRCHLATFNVIVLAGQRATSMCASMKRLCNLPSSTRRSHRYLNNDPMFSSARDIQMALFRDDGHSADIVRYPVVVSSDMTIKEFKATR
ncbi:hypothetical protein PYCCODRAFT_1238794 [Trametes coccinea BRFM310]|uniref:Uncharacterized protein n=1 Tax=Trametes coccinea (strain BRFM310) TaxID=1353009 RepID=A0A1Y2IWC0_TRAC3|nr:hypothetical protein PYCCODRAFT_1238794 [Trametes coccinea BRFM310]